MKKYFALAATLIMFVGIGCQKTNKQLLDRISKLEKRIEVLEKRLTAAAPPARKAPAEQTEAFDLPIGESYVKGNPSAKVVVTKFSDYQCPFCSRAQDSFVNKIFEDPQLKNNVKVVFKHFPLSFHKDAKPASKAALAAGEQGHDCFWEMTDKLYSGQKELKEGNFKKWASDLKCNGGKFDASKFMADYKSKDAKYEKMIKDDMNLGMSKAGVRGTPTFMVNGWKLGRRSVDALKTLIDQKGIVKLGANAAN